MKSKNGDRRYVWSPECGGCIMEQRFDGQVWLDYCSQDEGEFPLYTDRVKAIVDWQNLSLKKQKISWKIQELQLQIAKLQAKSDLINKKQETLRKTKISLT